MRDVVSYLRHFPDRYHHPREDAEFTCLPRGVWATPSDASSANRERGSGAVAVAVAKFELFRHMTIPRSSGKNTPLEELPVTRG